MDNNKTNNNSLFIIIIILIVLVLSLGSYIIYDKLIEDKNTNKDTEITDKNTNKNTETTDNNNEEIKEEKLSNADTLIIGNELWKYAHDTYWGHETVWPRHWGEKNQYGGNELICDTTVEKVKQKYAKDFTAKSCIGGGCDNYTLDTFVPQTACESAGRGGIQSYRGTTLSVKEIQTDKVIFTATSKYYYESLEERKEDFVIVKQNNTWLIKEYYLPD